MKFAVISDIHGNIDALEAVLSDIDRRGIEHVLNLGDCLSGPFDAAATVERLIALGIPTVSGNHDRQLYDRPRSRMGLWEAWIIDDLSEVHLDWIRSLPSVLNWRGILLCHGTPTSDEENWLDYRSETGPILPRDLPEVLLRADGVEQDVILCGHTHTPRSVRLPDGRLIVNPGSVGCPAYEDSRSSPAFIHETGSPDARFAILERVDDGWRIDLCSVAYDAGRMAEMARSRGAETWARAVSTGWVT